ncbi:MAG: CheY-like chemotaxis protein [Lentisphaeria bacterium]|jgi:CheY-like chemotaxis protein
MQELAMCFYPTQVAFIDDNETFLTWLTQILRIKNPHINFCSFSNPKAALDFTNESTRQPARPEWGDLGNMDAEEFFHGILNRSGQLRSNNTRFEEISVVVVDLDMPGIDGIEFCRKIQNPNIKKILLTGISATTKVLQAFNNKEIHYYLNKSDDNMDELLDGAIRRMQHEYFLELSRKLKYDALENSTPLFSDPALADYFDEICTRIDVKEYYFQTNPPRFHLELKNGSECDLLIYTLNDIASQLKIMDEESAPLELIKRVKKCAYLPLFPTRDGYYIPELGLALEHLHKSELVPGSQDFYCALTSPKLAHKDDTQVATPGSNSLH